MLYNKFEENQLSTLRDIATFLKITQLSSQLFLLHPDLKITFSEINFLQIWYTNKAYCCLSQPNIWRCLS